MSRFKNAASLSKRTVSIDQTPGTGPLVFTAAVLALGDDATRKTRIDPIVRGSTRAERNTRPEIRSPQRRSGLMNQSRLEKFTKA